MANKNTAQKPRNKNKAIEKTTEKLTEKSTEKPVDQSDQKTEEPVWVNLEDLDASDIDDEYGDMVIEQRLQVNNEDALERITDDLRLSKDLPFTETLVVTSKKTTQVADVFDDLLREEAFYEQALEAAYIGRDLILKEGGSFSRPKNFIAPMLKDDKQMEAVRQRLLEEAKDGDEDALRRLQIFNKERKKEKAANEKVKLLARKKKDGAEVTLDDEFNLDLDEAERLAAATNTSKSKDDRPAKNYTRDTKNAKYSLGTKRKLDSGAGAAGNPAKKGMSFNKKSSIKRPGKAKRQTMRSRS